MIYNLLYPLSDTISIFNIFRYITFRSIYAFITALLISLIIGPRVIEFLKGLKIKQYIQDDVSFHMSKQGTPTMGGILIAIAHLFSVFLWSDITNPYIWLCILVFTGFGLVGFIDDYLKVVKKRNKGLTKTGKFLGQVIIGTIAVSFLIKLPGYSSKLYVPFIKWFNPDLGWFYIVFALFVMVASSNAVNLTDGLDGLAIGPTIIVAACLAIFLYIAGHVKIANYLQVAYVPGVGEVTVFCSSLVGASLGFLWFNAHPAQVFMGDVGSLSLGGTLGFLAILCKQELVLPIMGGFFVIETLSVIIQVLYFHWTGGKRVFKMAPIHHHFELEGIPESKIIVRCWIISILLGLVALSTLKLR